MGVFLERFAECAVALFDRQPKGALRNLQPPLQIARPQLGNYILIYERKS
jgi:hypothetical protein